MRAADWDPAALPSQSGRTILITGSTSSLGYAAARALSKAGAKMVLAARNEEKGPRAVEELLQTVPGANVRSYGQSPDEGAWPMLYAATSSKAESGVYYGPSGPGERKGLPDEAAAAPYAKDEANARMLWEISEELTGVRYLS